MRKPPLAEKDVLTPEEAISYFGFSRRKFYRLLSAGKFKKFTALYGNRKLLLRVELEKYLSKNPALKEALKNGRQTQNQT